ncbi:MAG: hypothetical protein JJ866_15410 [Roseibium sp.]|nr:hypothetical protein [Roseibium sp.]MBO6893331.1 hypothetical protein [Roseibium sp.]MBO6932784.1 hypothetical protein [Roseibium sp.]
MISFGILLGTIAVLVGLPTSLFLAAVVARAGLTGFAFSEGRSLFRR